MHIPPLRYMNKLNNRNIFSWFGLQWVHVIVVIIIEKNMAFVKLIKILVAKNILW